MNRGVLQSSPVQQMMVAGTPNWWNMNNMRAPPPQPPQQPPPSSFLIPPSNFFPQYTPQPPTTSSLIPIIPSWHDNNQELPAESWSQLLLGGLVNDEDKSSLSQMEPKKLETWEDQLLSNQAPPPNGSINEGDHIKHESSPYVYGHIGNVEYDQTPKPTNWSQMMIPLSSPKSCVTSTLSTNLLDFSSNKASDKRPPPSDISSECNSTASGGALKKARVQPSSTQSTFKVRKEKLGDRITALHQLVSPFGKTDTASVLLEAIGYIRFLQSQIEALSLPYLGSGPGNTRHQHSVQGERNCLFPEDPGQLLNDNCMKRKGASHDKDSHEEPNKDLRSRGLCLVPISCTLQVGSDNGADYWAPALNGGLR